MHRRRNDGNGQDDDGEAGAKELCRTELSIGSREVAHDENRGSEVDDVECAMDGDDAQERSLFKDDASHQNTKEQSLHDLQGKGGKDKGQQGDEGGSADADRKPMDKSECERRKPERTCFAHVTKKKGEGDPAEYELFNECGKRAYANEQPCSLEHDVPIEKGWSIEAASAKAYGIYHTEGKCGKQGECCRGSRGLMQVIGAFVHSFCGLDLFI